jgi:hypothetical protein
MTLYEITLLDIFSHTAKPMRIHPLLVTASKDIEIGTASFVFSFFIFYKEPSSPPLIIYISSPFHFEYGFERKRLLWEAPSRGL